MALHTQLDIYQHAYALLRLSLVGKKNMRKDFKNSLGTRIHDECIAILMAIARANATPEAERAPHIQDMLTRVDTVQFLLRVCNDERLIGSAVWADAIALLQIIGAKGGGWLRHTRRKAPAA
jgi:hypothetical protein